MRALDLIFLLLFSGVSLQTAASNDVRSRYLVGTEGASSSFAAKVAGDRVVTSFSHVDAFAVELTESEVMELRQHPGIRYVEPDFERRAAAPAGAYPAIPHRVDDPQTIGYGVILARAPELWPMTRGATVKVGVIDTGIDLDHPDLRDRYRGGYDFVSNDAVPEDNDGHGTHVSGIIAGSDNEIGVIGVAPEVDLYALKILDPNDQGSASGIVRAVEWAIDHQLDVINMSISGAGYSKTEADVLERAVAAGIVCVAAAGNSYPIDAGVTYPAAYPSVIAVGALDATLYPSEASQRGDALELMAAGIGVNSTWVVAHAYRIEGEGLLDVFGRPFRRSPLPSSAGGTLVAAGLGSPGEFPDEVAGNIALIRRGSLTFNEQSQNAQNAGATAAIIYNNQPREFNGDLCSNPSNCVPPNVPADPILTVSIGGTDGETVLVPHDGSAITMTPARYSTYTISSGTSMASPYVAGIAVLLRALVPGATSEEIREAMGSGARDLGEEGRDTTFGFGLASAMGAANVLAPELFWSELPRRRAVSRPH